MKMKWTSVCLCALAALAVFFFAPASAEAGAGIQTLRFPESYKTYVSKTYTGYDITGDGRADRIVVTCRSALGYKGWFDRLTIRVNGKTAYNWANKNNWSYLGLKLKLCTLRNGKVYFFVQGYIENEDASLCLLLRYSGGKLNTVCNFVDNFAGGAHLIGEPTAVSGNTIVYDAKFNTPAMAWMGVRYRFAYGAGGLKLKSKTGEVVDHYSSMGPAAYYTLQRAVNVYRTATTKSTFATLAKGTKVRITHIYINGKKTVRFKLVKKNGTAYWVNGKLYGTKTYMGERIKCPIIREFGYAG